MASTLSHESAEEVAATIKTKLFVPLYGELLTAISHAVSEAENALKQLKQIASKIQKHHDSVKIARGVGATVGVVAAPVAIGSLVAAPFTGGLSLAGALVTAGISSSVVAAGTATNAGSAAVGMILSETLLSDASDALKRYEDAESRLRTLYRLFEVECDAIYWECPEIRSRFSRSDFVSVALLACACGAAFLKISGITDGIQALLTNNIGQAFSGGIVAGVKAAMATALQELSAICCSIKEGFSIVTGLSTIGLTAIAVVGVVAVVATMSFNIYTLVELFKDSPSEAVQKVRAVEVQVKQRKEQLKSLLEEIKTTEWINKHRW